jgi:hypothetical protein
MQRLAIFALFLFILHAISGPTAWSLSTRDAFVETKGDSFIPHDALGQAWLSDEELLKVWPNSQSIERIETSLDDREFMERFHQPGVPIVLSGRRFGGFGDPRMDNTEPPAQRNERLSWTWERFRDEYGQVEDVYKFSSRHYNQNCSLGMLCPVGTITMQKLVDNFILNTEWMQSVNNETVIPYLRDLSLQQHFPPLDEQVQFPSMLHADLLAPFQGTRWPTAFFAPAGTRSELHHDYGGSAFTMTPLLGRKAFALFPPRDVDAVQSCGPNHPIVDVWNPDFDSCTSAHQATLYLATLYPGDVLFVPAKWMHAVRNLDANVGITRNFVSALELDSVQTLLANRVMQPLENLHEVKLDWSLAASYDLGRTLGRYPPVTRCTPLSKSLANRAELLQWNRDCVYQAFDQHVDAQHDVSRTLALLALEHDLTSLLAHWKVEYDVDFARPIRSVDLLKDEFWQSSSAMQVFRNDDDRAQVYQWISYLKINSIMSLRRRLWNGNQAQTPAFTDNTNEDALGEPWLLEEEAVRVWQGNRVPVFRAGQKVNRAFLEDNFIAQERPFVLRGAAFGGIGANVLSGRRWSWERFRAEYGQVAEAIKYSSRHYEQECDLGMLCQVGWINMNDLIEQNIYATDWQTKLRAQDPPPSTAPYLRDLPLKTNFPDLFADVEFSSAFVENILDFGGTRWPTAFFAPAGTRSELHHDYGGTAFTMTPMFGRKEFILFPYEDEGLIMHCPGKEPIIDVWDPDFEQCPEARKAHASFATLYPGDVLYVPSLWMHAIRNHDANVGITRNFVSLQETKRVAFILNRGIEETQPEENGVQDIDYNLAMTLELAVHLKSSFAYLQQRVEFPDVQLRFNQSSIAQINRKWVEEALRSDSELSDRLEGGLGAFALHSVGQVLEMAAVPKDQIVESAYHGPAHEMLRDTFEPASFLHDSSFATHVITFVQDRKREFVRQFKSWYQTLLNGSYEQEMEEDELQTEHEIPPLQEAPVDDIHVATI